jgi:hypothetical protein
LSADAQTKGIDTHRGRRSRAKGDYVDPLNRIK